MAGAFDFFSKKLLGQAAGPADAAPTAPQPDSTYDIGKMAQQQADWNRANAQLPPIPGSKPKTPGLAAPKKKKPLTGAASMQNNMLNGDV